MWAIRVFFIGLKVSTLTTFCVAAAVNLENAALYTMDGNGIKLLVVLPSRGSTSSQTITIDAWRISGSNGESSPLPGLYISYPNDPNRFVRVKAGIVSRALEYPNLTWGDPQSLRSMGTVPTNVSRTQYRAFQFDDQLLLVDHHGKYTQVDGEYTTITTFIINEDKLMSVAKPLMNKSVSIYTFDPSKGFRPLSTSENADWLIRDNWNVHNYVFSAGSEDELRLESTTRPVRIRLLQVGQAMEFEQALVESEVAPTNVPSRSKETAERGLTILKTENSLVALIGRDVRVDLPVNLARLADPKDGTQSVEYEVDTFLSEGRHYFLLHISHDLSEVAQGDRPIENPGDVILLREDGVHVTIGYELTNIYSFSVSDDGIFSHLELPRRIDLRRFEIEAQRPSTPSADISTPEGPISALTLLKRFTQESSEDLRLRKPNVSDSDIKVANKLAIIAGQRHIRNPVLLAQASAGKSHTLHAFTQLAAEGRLPSLPRTARFLDLTAAAIVGGTENVGQFENRIQAMRFATAQLGHLYFICDELTALKGGGTHSGNPHNDFFEQLKPFLANGSISLISATTPDDFRLHIAPHPTVVRRFQAVELPAISKSEVLKILRLEAEKATIPIRQSEIETIYARAEYFNATESQPGKSVAFADRVFSVARAEKITRITKPFIDRVAAEFYMTNPDRLSPNGRVALYDSFNAGLEKEFVGSAEVKSALRSIFGQIILGVNDPHLPRGRILLFGKKGRGKTSLVRMIHRLLNLHEKSFTRIQMSHIRGYNAVDTVLGLIGEAAQRSAESTILLDDFEKVDHETQNALLDILDSGKFSTVVNIGGNAKRSISVDARRLLIVIATNAGEAGLSKPAMGFSHTISEPTALETEAAINISPYVLSRIPHRLHLRSLSRAEITDLMKAKAILILQELEEPMNKRRLAIDFQAHIDNLLSNYEPEVSDPRHLLEQLSFRLRNAAADNVLSCLRATAQLGGKSEKLKVTASTQRLVK